MRTILVNLILKLTSDLISSFFVSEAYSFLTNNFPQMCLMLDQFLWGHLSRYCDVSFFLKVVLLHIK